MPEELILRRRRKNKNHDAAQYNNPEQAPGQSRERVDGLTRQLHELIMPSILRAGAELVELTLKCRGRTQILEVLVDKESGGITIGECSAINREIFKQCDQTQILGEDFEVEVSSPGLDRPLRTPKDFSRKMGQLIQIHLRAPVNARLEYSGTIKDVKDSRVVVDTPQGLLELSIDNIQKAVQEI